jgi:tRNA modification GTPase
MKRSDETICAPATGTGGALAVIRVSGQQSISICDRIFRLVDEGQRLTGKKGYSLVYGDIRTDAGIVDDVLVSIFRAPHSYTGEDSVEISCHASPYIIKKILELLITNGAISALPGEFTQRAFMNGRMDLLQAEAVADVIAAETKSAHRIAVNQLRGGFSSEIATLRAGLLHFASLLELELDFGEEDVEFADRTDMKNIIVRVKELSDNLADSFRIGNAIKNGIPVTIAGKPNSGKSTLLNALLQEEKAIVSEIPGTTRDTIEDTIVIDGIEYRFIDTAGLRETSDVIENLGIQRTYEKISKASVILLVDEVNESAKAINERAEFIRNIVRGQEKTLIIIINKIDQNTKEQQIQLSDKIKLEGNDMILFISAKQKYGLDKLRQYLSDLASKEKLTNDSVIITSVRHYEALVKISESLSRVLEGLENMLPEDLIAIDIRQAIHYLGEITGEITTDEVLGNIFKNFCIGK